MRKYTFIILFVFSLVLVSAVEIQFSGDGEGQRQFNMEIPGPPLFDNNTGSVNSSDFWDNLDTPADIDHNLLNNLEWSAAGHIIDTDLDMNSNNIDEVQDITLEGNIKDSSNNIRMFFEGRTLVVEG